MTLPFMILIVFSLFLICNGDNLPIAINTWAFREATLEAFAVISYPTNTALDAVELGCLTCERLQCDGTVGYGGSPDENGETTLDAMIMDGANMNVGAVAGLRRIKDAIAVARYVLQYTEHTLLVGDQATDFAKQMGFKEQSLSTPISKIIWKKWEDNNCQPNFWTAVNPDPKEQCGPYRPMHPNNIPRLQNKANSFSYNNHDTIGMIVIDKKGNISAGTSTNGATHKIPGRVGDSPIPGAGAYADNDVGAAVATGDGDIMMRFLPSFLAVEDMRRGSKPNEAATNAIQSIIRKHPKFFGGLVAVNKFGEYSAACTDN